MNDGFVAHRHRGGSFLWAECGGFLTAHSFINAVVKVETGGGGKREFLFFLFFSERVHHASEHRHLDFFFLQPPLA